MKQLLSSEKNMEFRMDSIINGAKIFRKKVKNVGMATQNVIQILKTSNNLGKGMPI